VAGSAKPLADFTDDNQVEVSVPALTSAREVRHEHPRLKSISESVGNTQQVEPARPDGLDARAPVPAVVKANEQGKRQSEDNSRLPAPGPRAAPSVQVAQAVTIEETTLIQNVAPQLADSTRMLKPEPSQTAVLTPHAPSPPMERSAPEAMRASPLIVKPDVARDESRIEQIQTAALAEPAPSVRITIGRVDVRAVVTPPPPAGTRALQPELKALSLHEYLRQRNGDQR